MPHETFRVLVIDDEVGITEILDAFLTTAGYDVAVANEAQAGIEKARGYHPDIILIDVQMTGMDGYEINSALKEDSQTADIPVVFMTGQKGCDPARDTGSLWVKKPFSCEHLLDIVKIVLLSVDK